MQTFLPYQCFTESVIHLDTRRAWKQVIEARQIIDCLEGRKTGWANHPAVKMWVGHIPELKLYFNVFLGYCKNTHAINTKYEPYDETHFQCRSAGQGIGNIMVWPWWLGQEEFHRAMRARLIEKDRAFYLPQFPGDEGYNGGKYWWPDMKGKFFYTI